MLVRSLFRPVCGHLPSWVERACHWELSLGALGMSESLGWWGEEAGKGQGASSGGCAWTGTPAGVRCGVRRGDTRVGCTFQKLEVVNLRVGRRQSILSNLQHFTNEKTCRNRDRGILYLWLFCLWKRVTDFSPVIACLMLKSFQSFRN